MSRRAALSASAGFTLIEVLIVMVLGILTLGVTVSLVVSSSGAATRVSERVAATQRGRVALEQMTQQLRSQVCLAPGVPPVVEAESTRVRFYADLTAAETFVPDLRQLEWTSDGRLLETRWAGTGAAPATTYVTAPQERQLADHIIRIGGSEPVFRYYAFGSSGASGAFDQLTPPLSAADRARVVKIEIRFAAEGEQANRFQPDPVALETAVYTRLADPTDPTQGPACL